MKKREETVKRPVKLGVSMKNIDWQLHLMIALPILMLIVFQFIPLFGLRLAFVEKYSYVDGIWNSPWGGFKQFAAIFNMENFTKALLNTLTISVSKLVLGFPVPIIVSLLLNEVRCTKVKKSVQTAIYLPYFLSWVLLAGMMKNIFMQEGLFDRILGAFGIHSDILWLQDNRSFVPLIVFSDIWKGFGFGTVIYLAGLTNVDQSLYEAAEIDGAGRWRQTFSITIPTIVPLIMLNLVLNVGGILNAGFDQIFVLYSPKVYQTADIIDTLVYRITLQNQSGGAANYPIGTAIGLFKSVIALILVVGSNLVMVKTSDYRIF